MRKSYQTKIPGLDFLLREFLTVSENSVFNERIGPFSSEMDYAMLTRIDFPKQKLLLDSSYSKVDLKEGLREAIEKRDKNLYGILSKHAYGSIRGKYGSINNLHDASLLYLIKTSKDLDKFKAVLEKDIWLIAKQRVVGLLDIQLKSFMRQSAESLKVFYRKLVFKDLNINDPVVLDEKEELQITQSITEYFDQDVVRSHLNQLFQQCKTTTSSAELKADFQNNAKTIIKEKKSDVSALPPLDEPKTAMNITTVLQERILKEVNFTEKFQEYCHQYDPLQATVNPEAQKIFLLLRKLLPLFWKQMKLKAEELVKQSDCHNENAKQELQKKLMNQLEQFFYNAFWDVNLKGMGISVSTVKELVGLDDKIGKFYIFFQSLVSHVKDRALHTLSGKEAEQLNFLQKINKNEILFDRWKENLRVNDYYGSILFWTNLKARSDITNYLFKTIFNSTRDAYKLFISAILCNQSLKILKKLFDFIDITQEDYMQYMDYAISCGNTTAVKFLASALNININNYLINNRTALQAACANGDLQMIQCLHLECGADLMAINEITGSSALTSAVQNNRLRSVYYLMKNVKKDSPQEIRNFIEFFGNQEILKLVKEKNDRSMVGLFKKALVDLDPKGSWQQYFSALESNLWIHKDVIAQGDRYSGSNIKADEEPEIIATDDTRNQKFEQALVYGNKSRIAEILENTDSQMTIHLLRKGYDDLEQKKDLDFSNRRRKGVLHLLLGEKENQFVSRLTWNCYQSIKYILEKSTTPLKIQDCKGRTPLSYAIRAWQLNSEDEVFYTKFKVLIKLLIKKGADTQIVYDDKETPESMIRSSITSAEKAIIDLKIKYNGISSGSGKEFIQQTTMEIEHCKDLLGLLKTKPEDIKFAPDEEEKAFGVMNEGIDYLNSLDDYIDQCVALHNTSKVNFTVAPTTQSPSESSQELKSTMTRENLKPETQQSTNPLTLIPSPRSTPEAQESSENSTMGRRM